MYVCLFMYIYIVYNICIHTESIESIKNIIAFYSCLVQCQVTPASRQSLAQRLAAAEPHGQLPSAGRGPGCDWPGHGKPPGARGDGFGHGIEKHGKTIGKWWFYMVWLGVYGSYPLVRSKTAIDNSCFFALNMVIFQLVMLNYQRVHLFFRHLLSFQQYPNTPTRVARGWWLWFHRRIHRKSRPRTWEKQNMKKQDSL